MEEERRSVSEVTDKVADRWIKIIGLVALFTFPLIGTIGKLILNNMDEISARQVLTIDQLGKINGFLGTHESKISRNTQDIQDINVKVDGNTAEINKLKGIR